MPTTRPRLEVLKVGSDPEALFLRSPRNEVVPATAFTGRRNNFRAWIGTDGRSSTAELRPRPSRDVYLHVRDIAEAITTIERTLSEKDPDVFMAAQPCFNGSPCGGHIHVSFKLHDPIAVPAIVRGYVYGVDGEGLRTVTRPDRTRPFPPLYPPPTTDPTSAYRTAYITGREVFGLQPFANKLDTFIRPLEGGLYSTEVRSRRTYGQGGDQVRAEHAPVVVAPDVVKWRLEYRYPSTWLSHPALALTYLGLAKLAVNNFHLPLPPQPPSLSNLPDLVTEVLARQDAVVTNDVNLLPKIIRFVLAEIAPRLREPLVRVDFDAWARFLNEGRFK